MSRTPPPITHNTTGYRGVYWDSSHARFAAEIGSAKSGTLRRLGRFATAKEAAEAYDIAAQELYGDEAVLNFPLGESLTFKSVRHIRDACPYGHPFPENRYEAPSGRVNCRECNRLAVARLYRKKKADAS